MLIGFGILIAEETVLIYVEVYSMASVLLGSSHWLNRNMISLMCVGTAAVSIQIRFQSRLGFRIAIFFGLLTSWIHWR
jgi:hypothetical protein